MLLFSGTFDVQRRDWRALLRRMRLLRLGLKQQKMRVLRMKSKKTRGLRKKKQYNPPLSARFSLTTSSGLMRTPRSRIQIIANLLRGKMILAGARDTQFLHAEVKR